MAHLKYVVSSNKNQQQLCSPCITPAVHYSPLFSGSMQHHHFCSEPNWDHIGPSFPLERMKNKTLNILQILWWVCVPNMDLNQEAVVSKIETNIWPCMFFTGWNYIFFTFYIRELMPLIFIFDFKLLLGFIYESAHETEVLWFLP